MGTTPIYSLAYPDFSDNVADGATAIQTLATDIEDMIDVYAGLKKIIPTGPFVGATFDARGNGSIGGSTIDIGGCFSAGFNAYRIVMMNMPSALNSATITAQLISSDITGSVYYAAVISASPTTTSLAGSGGTRTNAPVGYIHDIFGNTHSVCVFDVYNPFQSVRKAFDAWIPTGNTSSASHGRWYTVVDSTVSSSGLRFPSSPMIGGTVSIYGYNV